MDSMSGMHFRDSNRKVDYVLVYHYRKRLTQHNPGAGSPGPMHRAASMAIVSNGETKKGCLNLQSDNDQHTPQETQVIELDPLDALEEEKRLQREEYESNLMAAGLEIEKDIEVRRRKLCILLGTGCSIGNGHHAVQDGHAGSINTGKQKSGCDPASEPSLCLYLLFYNVNQ